MAINVIVKYNGRFLPDILLLIEAPTDVCMVRRYGTIIVYHYYPRSFVSFCLVALHGD